MVFDAVGSHHSRMLSLKQFRTAMDRAGHRPEAGGHPARDATSAAIRFSHQLPTLREAERALVTEALERAQGNQSIAARMLGITRQALNRRVRARRK